MRDYYVYILTNRRNKLLYIGVTNDLKRRVYEHRHKLLPGFTADYGIDKLVYCEVCHSAEDAIRREKQLKKWRREKKIALIERINPHWNDLSEGAIKGSLDFARDDREDVRDNRVDARDDRADAQDNRVDA